MRHVYCDLSRRSPYKGFTCSSDSKSIFFCYNLHHSTHLQNVLLKSLEYFLFSFMNFNEFIKKQVSKSMYTLMNSTGKLKSTLPFPIGYQWNSFSRNFPLVILTTNLAVLIRFLQPFNGIVKNLISASQ